MKSHESPKTNPICEVAEILAVGLIRYFTKNLPDEPQQWGERILE